MTGAAVTSLQVTPDLVRPDYNVYRFRDDMYKIVHFKSTAPQLGIPHRRKEDGYLHDDKLPQSISRARRVCLEYALCNDWKWFATFTIAENNYDRKNLKGFYEKFSEWLKYQRKKTGKEIPYVLVPEQHGDGSWHLHGFFNADIDCFLVPFQELWDEGVNIPYKLVKKGYYNWPGYQKKFGFCSFGKIRNHDATAFYVTKYISKSFLGDARRVGLRLYYNSQNLNRANYLDSVYGSCSALDRCLQNHYEFCSTGFFSFQREAGDDPLLDILESQGDLHSYIQEYGAQQAPLVEEDFPEVDEYYEMMQECIYGFS